MRGGLALHACWGCDVNAPLSAEAVRVKALRDGIDDMLEQCTQVQQAFLHRIHDSAPWKGLANCPDSKLPETYELLRRTISANRAAGEL